MLGWIFGGLIKKFEKATKKVSQDFVNRSSQELQSLFEHQIYPLADKLDYIGQSRINQALEGAEKLENKTKQDIENLLGKADDKVKNQLETINEIREAVIKDVRETIMETDFYVENRINQLSFVVMEALNSTEEKSQTILSELAVLENQLFQDANQIIDKIDELIDEKLEQVRIELRKYLGYALPAPLDKCRQRLKISWKPGVMLSDMEVYELRQCYELNKLNENIPIDDVLKIYGQLQLDAARMSALVKKSPELRRRTVEDWLKYGLLCEFWRSVKQRYSVSDNFLKKDNHAPKLLSSN